MERMMGRADTPVRRVLNYASDHFAQNLPIVYVQTVVSKNAAGKLVIRGLYIGDDAECFELAAELSLKVNFMMMDREIKKAVVFLDPHEFKTHLAGQQKRLSHPHGPGRQCGTHRPRSWRSRFRRRPRDRHTHPQVRLLRHSGNASGRQRTTPSWPAICSAAAHLIHGSSEGRFTIRYCPGHLTREEIEGVHFDYGDLAEYIAKYDPEKLSDGWNIVDGEEIFFISNPALALWAYEGRLAQQQQVAVGTEII